jgi:hypothetical protein
VEEHVSEREARNYDCPRLGRPVVVSYLYEGDSQGDSGRDVPRGVHCSGALECGVERAEPGGGHQFDWGPCPLGPELVREGFLPP